MNSNKVYTVEHTFSIPELFENPGTVKATFQIEKGYINLIKTEGFLLLFLDEKGLGELFTNLLKKAGLIDSEWSPCNEAVLVSEGNSIYSFWDGCRAICL